MAIIVNTKTKKQEKVVKDFLNELDIEFQSLVAEDSAPYKTSRKKPLTPTEKKEQILQGIKQAVKEINLVKAGKLKARDARAVINEL